MNILIAADLVTFSGVGNYIKGLATKLVDLGHKVVVFSPINDIGLGLNDGVIYIKSYKVNKNPIGWVRNVHLLAKVVKEHGIEVIHTNHRMTAFIVSLYNKFHKHVPMVWTCHTVPYPNNLAKRIFGSYGDRSMAISSEAKAFMLDELKIDHDRIDVVLNGVDESALNIPDDIEVCELKRQFDIDESKIVVCMHGRLDRVKGVDLTVKAVAELEERYKNKLVVVLSGKTDGNTYYDGLINEIDALGIKDNFRFVGWVTPRTILGVSDLMIAPSRREGFPLSAIEAFFMRVPVIRTKVGGYLDMADVCDGIESENSHVIAQKLREFIDNPGKYNDMTDRAETFAKNNCTIERQALATVKTYAAAISQRKSKQ